MVWGSVFRYLRSGAGSRQWRAAGAVLSWVGFTVLGWILSGLVSPHGRHWLWAVIAGVVGVVVFLFAWPGISLWIRDRRGGWTRTWEEHLSRPDGSTGVKHPDGTTEYQIQLRAKAKAHGGASAENQRTEAKDPEDRAE